MRTPQDVKYAFTPTKMDVGQTQRVLKLQIAAQSFAEEIVDLVPESADRTHALRLALDVKFWCVQAISHYSTNQPPPTAEKGTTDGKEEEDKNKKKNGKKV